MLVAFTIDAEGSNQHQVVADILAAVARPPSRRWSLACAHPRREDFLAGGSAVDRATYIGGQAHGKRRLGRPYRQPQDNGAAAIRCTRPFLVAGTGVSSHTDETSEVTAEIASSIETAGLNVGAFRIVVRNSAIDPKRTMPTKRLFLARNGTL